MRKSQDSQNIGFCISAMRVIHISVANLRLFRVCRNIHTRKKYKKKKKQKRTTTFERRKKKPSADVFSSNGQIYANERDRQRSLAYVLAENKNKFNHRDCRD